jgi:RNA polymerase sigma-70 factor (ECF subfamily)
MTCDTPTVELTFTARDTERALGRLTAIVRSTCPAALRGHEDDLVQNGMVRVLRGFERGQTINASYLRTVGRSVIVDALRRRRAEPAEPAAVEVVASPAWQRPDARARDQQIAHHVAASVQALYAPRREVVRLYLSGHNVPQIAAQLDICRKKAENLCYRGLADLRGHLTERGLAPC